MKALTVYQPYATLICPGPKRIENRTWAPWRSMIGKRIAIHAGKVCDGSAAIKHEALISKLLPEQLNLPRGAVVGTAIVWGYVTRSEDEWFVGPIGWQLSDVRTLKEPIPCIGKQGLWDLPAEIEERINVAAIL